MHLSRAVQQLVLLLVIAAKGVCSSHKQTVRLAAFVGIKHTYDLPNAIAAQVAVERINEDDQILPNITLELDILDTTIVRTMEARYEGISDQNMEAIKLDIFSNMLGNSLHELCEHTAISGGMSQSNAAACRNHGGIAAVIGPLYSSEAVLLDHVLRHYDLLTISYGATNPSLANRSEFPNFARTIPSDLFQGEAIAGLVQHIRVSDVQLWSCSDLYCQGLETVFLASIRSLQVAVRVDTFSTSNVDMSSLETTKSLLQARLKNCSAPRVMVLMVQRAHAEHLFTASRQLGVAQDVIWIGPASVTGLSVSLPHGYLGLSISGLNQQSTEFAQLQRRWDAYMVANAPVAKLLSGRERELKTWPYVGFAYDAVLAVSQALHLQSLGQIFNTSLMKQVLAKQVSFAGASSRVDFTAGLEPKHSRYLIQNKRSSNEAPDTIAIWNNEGLRNVLRPDLNQDKWLAEAVVWPSAAGSNPQVDCAHDCSSGSQYNSTLGACEKCPPGSYENQGTCKACDLGTHAPVSGMITCLPCDRGYVDEPGQKECKRCPANSEIEDGRLRVSVHECVCFAPAFYRLMAGSSCIPCEEGLNCGDQRFLYTKPGFYRGQDTTCLRRKSQGWLHLIEGLPNSTCGNSKCQCNQRNPAAILPSQDTEEIRAAVLHVCPRKRVCNPISSFRMEQGLPLDTPANMSANRCAKGHMGLRCEEGWVMTRSRGCIDCKGVIELEQAQLSPLFITLCTVVSLVVWYFAAWAPLLEPPGFSWPLFILLTSCPSWVKAKNAARDAQLHNSTHEDLVRETERVEAWLRQKQYISGAIKIIISFVQIIGQFGTSFTVEWPRELEFLFVDVSAGIQLDIENMPTFSCVMRRWSFLEIYRTYIISPLVGLAFLTIPTVLCMCLGILFHGGIRNHPRYPQVSLRCIVCFFYIFFLIYPPLSSFVLRGFVCIDYGIDGKWLNVDHRVSCDPNNAEYHALRFWVWFAFALYPVGIPLIFLGTIYYTGIPKMAHKKRIAARFTALLQLRHTQVSNMANCICVNAIGYCTRHERSDDGDASRGRPDSEFQRRVAYLINGEHGNGSSGLRKLFRTHEVSSGSDSGKVTPTSKCGANGLFDSANAGAAAATAGQYLGSDEEHDVPELSMDVADLRIAIARLGGVEPHCIPKHNVLELLRKYDHNDNGLGYKEFVEMLHDLVQVHCRFTGYEKLENLNRRQLESLFAHDWSLSSQGDLKLDQTDASSEISNEELIEFDDPGEVDTHIMAVKGSRTTRRVVDSHEISLPQSISSQFRRQESNASSRLSWNHSHTLSFLQPLSRRKMQELRHHKELSALNGELEGPSTPCRRDVSFSTMQNHGSGKKVWLSNNELRQFVLDKALQLEKEGKLPKQDTQWTKKLPTSVENKTNLCPKYDAHYIERVHEVNALRRVTFLVLTYRVDVWYFEIVTMIYKLLMASVVIWVVEQSSQLALAFLANFSFLLVIYATRPYLSAALQRLQVLTLVVICIDLLVGLMLSTGGFQSVLGRYQVADNKATSVGDNQFRIVTTLILAINVMVVVVPLIQIQLDRNPLFFESMLQKMYNLMCVQEHGSGEALGQFRKRHSQDMSVMKTSSSADENKPHPNDPTLFGITALKMPPTLSRGARGAQSPQILQFPESPLQVVACRARNTSNGVAVMPLREPLAARPSEQGHAPLSLSVHHVQHAMQHAPRPALQSIEHASSSWYPLQGWVAGLAAPQVMTGISADSGVLNMNGSSSDQEYFTARHDDGPLPQLTQPVPWTLAIREYQGVFSWPVHAACSVSHEEHRAGNDFHGHAYVAGAGDGDVLRAPAISRRPDEQLRGIFERKEVPHAPGVERRMIDDGATRLTRLGAAHLDLSHTNSAHRSTRLQPLPKVEYCGPGGREIGEGGVEAGGRQVLTAAGASCNPYLEQSRAVPQGVASSEGFSDEFGFGGSCESSFESSEEETHQHLPDEMQWAGSAVACADSSPGCVYERRARNRRPLSVDVDLSDAVQGDGYGRADDVSGLERHAQQNPPALSCARARADGRKKKRRHGKKKPEQRHGAQDQVAAAGSILHMLVPF